MFEAQFLRHLGNFLVLVAIGVGTSGCQEETIAGKLTDSNPAFGPTLVLGQGSRDVLETIAELIAKPIEKQLAARSKTCP